MRIMVTLAATHGLSRVSRRIRRRKKPFLALKVYRYKGMKELKKAVEWIHHFLSLSFLIELKYFALINLNLIPQFGARVFPLLILLDQKCQGPPRQYQTVCVMAFHFDKH